MTGDAAGLQLVPTALELGSVEPEAFEQAAPARAMTEMAATARRRWRNNMRVSFRSTVRPTEPVWTRSPVVRSTERLAAWAPDLQVTRTGLRAGGAGLRDEPGQPLRRR